MCDVLFVVPSKVPSAYQECSGSLLLATILRESGINADIYRFYEADMSKSFGDFVNETAENICRRNPRVVSFYCRCDYFLADIKIAERLKQINKDTVVVFGGPQATASCTEILEELPFVDYCCSGEGETTVVPLFGGLLRGEDVTSVRGLTYRNAKGEVVSNPVPELIKNLDDIPNIDYALIPPQAMQTTKERDAAITIDVGRGCPFNCAYCSTKVFWKRKFRVKSPKKIVDEMLKVNRDYGIKKFVFEHDLFTANKKNVLEFCNELTSSGLKIRWTCSSRIDTIDEEMIDAMVDAGCTEIYFGIETGSPRMQEIIHKKIRIPDVVRICKYLAGKKIKVIASFMYGFPEETEEDLEHTMRLVLELVRSGVNRFQFHLCTILPGTEYFEKYKNELVFAKSVSNIVSDFGVEENYDFICEHKRLFAFYYEYHNEHRAQLEHFDRIVLLVIEMYNRLSSLDAEKFKDMSLVDIFFAYKAANADVLTDSEASEDLNLRSKEMARNYLSSVYADDKLEKVCQILDYAEDCSQMYSLQEGAMDVRSYNVDVKAYVEKKPLDEIELIPSIVYFRKKNGKIENVINKM